MGVGVMMVAVVPVVVPMVMIVIMGMSLARADAFHVVVVTLLSEPNLIFKAEHLRAVFAAAAVHGRVTGQNLFCPLLERFDQERMVIQIGSLDEFNIRMAFGDPVRVIINPLDQDAGEQEVWKDNYSLKA